MITINNFTSYDLKDVLQILLDKVCKLDGITVQVLYNKLKGNSEVDYLGYTDKTPVHKTYNLFLAKDLDKNVLFKVICHESVHLEQYEEGRLNINKNKVMFEGSEYDPKLLSYYRRPWEAEAYNKERKRLKELKKLI